MSTRYTQRPTALSKEDEYEIVGPILQKNGKHAVDLTQVAAFRLYERFDGFLFARIRGRAGSISLTSHSAVGGGKPVTNKSAELAGFIGTAMALLPGYVKYTIGSKLWWYSGFILASLPVLVVFAVVYALVSGRLELAEMPFGALLALPAFLLLGIGLVITGKPRSTDRAGMETELAKYKNDRTG